MVIPRTLAAASAALIATTGLVAASGTAWAGQTWLQGYQRVDASAACGHLPDETPWESQYTGHRDWAPSWAQWPNDGRGGWVCERDITWAEDPSTSSTGSTSPGARSGPGCVSWMNGPFGPFWYDFLGSTYLPGGAPVYGDAACSTALGSTTINGTAYAADSTTALAICTTHGYSAVADRTNNVWSCL